MTIQDVIREIRQYAERHHLPYERWADAIEEAIQEPVVYMTDDANAVPLYAAPYTCPHIVSSDEGTSYCDLAEGSVQRGVEHSALLVEEIEQLRGIERAYLDEVRVRLECEVEIERLREALELILSARSRDFGLDYIEGCARAALAKEDK